MKQVYRRSAIYNAAFTIVNMGYMFVSGVVLIPLYLDYVGQGQYALWIAGSGLLAWLTYFDPGYGRFLTMESVRMHVEKSKDLMQLVYISTRVMAGLGVVILLLGLSIVFFNYVVDVYDTSDNDLYFNLCLLLISFVVQFQSNGLASIISGQQAAFNLGFFTLICNIASLVVCIIMLFSGFGLYSITISSILRNIGYYLVYRYLIKMISISNDELHIKRLGLSVCSWVVKYRKESAGQLSASILYGASISLEAFLLLVIVGPQLMFYLVMVKKIPEFFRFMVEKVYYSLIPSFLGFFLDWSLEKKVLIYRSLIVGNIVISSLLSLVLFFFGVEIAGFWLNHDINIDLFDMFCISISFFCAFLFSLSQSLRLMFGFIDYHGKCGTFYSAFCIIVITIGYFFDEHSLILLSAALSLLANVVYFNIISPKRLFLLIR